MAVFAAACGNDDSESAETTTTAPATTAPATTAAPETTAAAPDPEAEAAAAWEALIEAAKAEGEVNLYGSHALDNMELVAKEFEAEYGIKVNVFRGIDNDVHAKIQAERDTNQPVADVVTNATLAWQIEKSDAGWFAQVDLPAFQNPDYNVELNVSEKGDYFVVSAAVLTFGWNTDLLPEGLTDYTDLLNPELKGKIGVIEPANGAILDFWLYLEDKYGTDFTDKLAAQEPRIYPSSLPMGEALVSGEIAAASFVQVQKQAKADGAPVDSGLSDTVWGAIFNGAVMENAPNPNAARLLANYLLTPPGQRIAARAATALPGIPEAAVEITTDAVKRQDLSRLTPEALTAYQERWNALFK